jgi:hypothetical protein
VREVIGQGFADVDRERHPVVPRSLAAHDQFAAAPVGVIERQRGDLAAAQAKPRQQRQNREIPPPRRRLAIAAGRRRATWSASSDRGNATSRHDATDGTALANDSQTTPSTCRNRSNDRNAVTVTLADPRDRRREHSS